MMNNDELQKNIKTMSEWSSVQIMEAERIEEESIRLNQANIAMQIEEAQKLKKKWERQRKLKETLDQG